MRILSDTDKMPFGKYKGIPMQDVPATYLHWFWREGNRYTDVGASVYEYIKRSLDVLKMENSDLLW